MNLPPSQLDVLANDLPSAAPRAAQMWPPAPAALAAAGTGSQPAVRRGLVSQPAGQRGSGEHTQHERCHAADAQNGGRAPPKHWLSTLVAWNWPARPASGSNRAASRARASAASAQPEFSAALGGEK